MNKRAMGGPLSAYRATKPLGEPSSVGGRFAWNELAYLLNMQVRKLLNPIASWAL